MIIDLSKIDLQSFSVKEEKIAGDKCYLINPKPGTIEWTKDNLIFRSSIWDYRGRPISLSYKKFFNLDEKPWLTSYLPKEFYNKGINIVEKIDGSTLIISRYKGITIMRTRGSFDASTMPNGDELEIFKAKYKRFFEYIEQHETLDSSFIFEWISPRNIIVMPHKEPVLYLTNVIKHEDYSMYGQVDLDALAKSLALTRPTKYSFYSINDMIKNIEPHQGIEGVCIYFNNDQEIRKCKSANYLKLHAFRSTLNTNTIVDLFFDTYNMPESIDDFLTLIEVDYDYECKEASRLLAEKLYSSIDALKLKLKDLESFVNNNSSLNQKEFAAALQNNFTNNYLVSYGFMMRKNIFNFSKTKKQILELVKTAAIK